MKVPAKRNAVKSIEITLTLYRADGTREERSTWCSGDGVKQVTHGLTMTEVGESCLHKVVVSWVESETSRKEVDDGK